MSIVTDSISNTETNDIWTASDPGITESLTASFLRYGIMLNWQGISTLGHRSGVGNHFIPKTVTHLRCWQLRKYCENSR